MKMEVLIYISLAVFCLAVGTHIDGKPEFNEHNEQEDSGRSRFFRAAIEEPEYRWEGGIVNFIFEKQGFTSAEIDLIRRVLGEIEDQTKSGDKYCVRFVEKEDGDPVTSALRINKGPKCVSPLGREKPITRITFGKDCLFRLNLIHEFMHVLGFHHEHCRRDRDNYVNINMSNVPENLKDFFAIQNDVMTQGLPYDFESILQYQPYNHAVDPSWPTVYPKDKLPKGMQLGPRAYLSKIDVQRIQKYYSCDENTTQIESLLRNDYALYCDFEFGKCNMTQEKEDDFDWTLGSEGGSTPGTGPHRDHTSGIGNYLYADASNKRKGMRAIMKSLPFEPGQYCLSFALYFYGADIGQFTVSAQLPQATLSRFTATASNIQENRWVLHKISLNETRSWRILLEVEVGGGPKGDVAVDDLRIHSGDCMWPQI